MSRGILGHLGPLHLAMGSNCSIRSISLNFLLETRVQSKSFDTLDDLLGFWFQKLWCKVIKIFD